MRDQRIRMRLPQQCVYCGGVDNLAVDHVVSKVKGGADAGDNAVWACRSCNSSKSGRDVFEWWAGRPGLPPLFVVRLYLKQAVVYANANGLLDMSVEAGRGHPYRFDLVPVDYPQPGDLYFTPWHRDRQVAEVSDAESTRCHASESHRVSRHATHE